MTLRQRTITAIAALALALGALPAHAAKDAAMGRANPFKPLIVDEGAVEPGTAVAPPAVPLAPVMPLDRHAPPPRLAPPAPAAPSVVFMAVVSDAEPGGEAIAALRVDGATRFVRVGDAVGDQRVVHISGSSVTLRSRRATTVLTRQRP